MRKSSTGSLVESSVSISNSSSQLTSKSSSSTSPRSASLKSSPIKFSPSRKFFPAAPPSSGISNKTKYRDGIREDSGFSTMSHVSNENFNKKLETKKDTLPLQDQSNKLEKAVIKQNDDKQESTIGEGIKFVNPELIAEEMRVKASRIKHKDPEIIAERRREKEAYELEIQKKNYDSLMHLLKHSKSLSLLWQNKVDNKENINKAKGSKRKASTANQVQPPAKKSKKNTKTDGKKINLSAEDIEEQLESLSDDDKDQENLKPAADYVESKYIIKDLRDYQQVGVKWLLDLNSNGLNGILADEMGLGKTIQIIALFAHLLEKHQAGPYMIVVPLSTLANWITEFERFAPDLPIVVFYGDDTKRKQVKPLIRKKHRMPDGFMTQPIVLMTYEMPVNETKFLREFNWRCIVVDEAQRIKNFNSKLFCILKSLKSLNRLLLTGTPLQNNLTELWSLLNFLLPNVFKDLGVFETWFNAKDVQNEEGHKKLLKQEQEKQVMSNFREILKPFMLRRLKEEACPDIPPIKEVLVYAPLTNFQYELYTAILNRDLDMLFKKETNIIVDIDGVRPKRKCTQKIDLNYYYGKKLYEKKTSVLSSLGIEANKIQCNLKKEVVDRELEAWSKFTNVTEQNVNYLIRLRFGNDVMMYRHVVNHPYNLHWPFDHSGFLSINEDMIKVSGKLLVLDAMLKKLHSRGHKVLLFSSFKMVLDIIEYYAEMRDYETVRLDGDVDYEDRKECIDKFQTDPNVFLFLLTTRAGAVGLNLAAADTVIIYDSDWNPQMDLQAMSRCHRIGQTKPVVVYRLCTKGTVDEEIIKRANAKRFLEKIVISKEGSMVSSVEGLQRLKKLLDKNLFKIVDSKKEVYTDRELDDILDRSDLIKPESKNKMEEVNDTTTKVV